eukprot:CAMPEP_0184482652 /NCGR_PEP_ID=MMETSP0113_2-20130426/4231_1 /TAXON_ID=91329 /ORGANISM="Norrisiella sphaerica, Strain BC52" /LENGTH=97 /DNA_ID=CAMNT_0026862517 /DNA_START=382 /DNA_END=672 /DNA_ORIENTATION=+
MTTLMPRKRQPSNIVFAMPMHASISPVKKQGRNMELTWSWMTVDTVVSPYVYSLCMARLVALIISIMVNIAVDALHMDTQTRNDLARCSNGGTDSVG